MTIPAMYGLGMCASRRFSIRNSPSTYYFYFIDEMLGLCLLAVPTWCPFRALFYLNGHNWLASKLRSANISYELQDNAFAAIGDWQKAQQLSDRLMVKQLHTRLDAAVARCLPERLRLHGIIKKVGKTYKYYLTELGRHVAIAGLTLKNLFPTAPPNSPIGTESTPAHPPVDSCT
jgi:hypothetical protein